MVKIQITLANKSYVFQPTISAAIIDELTIYELTVDKSFSINLNHFPLDASVLDDFHIDFLELSSDSAN